MQCTEERKAPVKRTQAQADPGASEGILGCWENKARQLLQIMVVAKAGGPDVGYLAVQN
jgi:hypothetical protein